MVRRLSLLVSPAVALALLLFCYRAVLFEGGQFGYRDAAHYYYPLYQRVQTEWAAGRVPLWDPGENSGMPLLGNPTAAVLYPGKLIFAVFSYPWATRLYAVVHTALACAGMWVLVRGWRASATAASLAGLAFAFGSPILFQYCNIIFLVGAAWIPWGFWGIDRWLRGGRPSGLLVLALALALMVLGGDPESAYVLGLCSGGYAFLLNRNADRAATTAPRPRRAARRIILGILGVGLVLVGWVGLALLLATYLPGLRPWPGESAWGPFRRWIASGQIPRFRPEQYQGPVPGLAWISILPRLAALGWLALGGGLLVRWRRAGSRRVPLVPKLAGLAGSAILAVLLAGAQLLPVAEFTGNTGRASDEGPHDVYPFSLEPYRLVELVWPGVFGRTFGDSVAWMAHVLPGVNHRIWVHSLYLGGLTLVLALGAMAPRRVGSDAEAATAQSPVRSWLAGIAVIALLASFGECASPVWAARFAPALAKQLGPHDSPSTNSVRLDGFVRDGDGSPYSILTAILPGFQSFRFPSKLFTFVSLALAGLAGLGWDRVVAEGRRGWAGRLAIGGGAVSLLALGIVVAMRERLAAGFAAWGIGGSFGPLNPSGAVRDLMLATGQGTLVLGGAGLVMTLAHRRPRLASVLAVALMALDLGWANSTAIVSVPQSDFEATPSVLAHIAAAEARDPSPGPYRIHRVPTWTPYAWQEAGSPERIRDFVRWEHDTLQPKYGLLHGVEYTQTIGVAELYDYEWFFSPFPRSTTPDTARALHLRPGEPIVVYPRRGFDLWNTRYFVVPAGTSWNDPDRGIASFLADSRRIYPPPDAFAGLGGAAAQERWIKTEDVQVYKNQNMFPRAWIVHDVRFKDPVVGLDRRSRRETMEEILFSNDLFWQDPAREFYDPRQVAWVETADRSHLAGFLSRAGVSARETVQVVEHESTRVVLAAELETPGLVVLADVFYPGWHLTIDGQPAPIERVNRLMRGAAVGAGRHRLVYTYDPASFRVGLALSGLGLLIAGIAGLTWIRSWSRF